MKLKFLGLILIASMLLSGCSNNSAEINQAKIDACKTIMVKTQSGEILAMINSGDFQRAAFDKLAKLDEKYTDIAVAVHAGYLIANTDEEPLSEMNLLEYRKISAKISQFCSIL